MKKQTRIAILVAFLVAATGGWGFVRYQEAQEQARIAEMQAKALAYARAAAARQKAPVQRKRSEYSDFAMESAVPQAYTRPASDWQTNDKAFYQKIVSAGQFDVLVVPFQVQQWGFDRATRSLMTAALASAVAQAQKTKVPDPYLVAQALGDGQRQFKPEDYYRIAGAIGVKRIVWGFTGHDRNGKMIVTVMAQDRSETAPAAPIWSTPVTIKKFENIAFDDENSPIAAYEALLPEILKGIGLDATALASSKLDSRLDLTALPDSPMKLMRSDDNPARDAYAFLLFAALTPDYISRTKERFAEKAFLALARMSTSAPEYRVLQARAYMTMDYRPAAIKALGTPGNEEEKALLAALNGNLPELRAISAKEKHPWKRLLQKLDEINIATYYGVTNSKQAVEEMKALKLPGNVWPFLVARAFTEDDAWVQHENVHVKMLLDFEFPVKGYSLEDIVRAGAAVGDTVKLQSTVALSVFNHGRKFVELDAGKWCCEFSISRPGVLDYLDLLQAIGHDNLIRRISFQAKVQGSPGRAMEYANTLDAVYKGYPYYAVERSKVESALARSAGGAEQQGMLKSAYQNAFNAMYWEQGQSYISNYAQNQVLSVGRSDYGYFDNFYYGDIPYRPYYWTWAAGGDPKTMRANNEAALKNAAWEFRAVTQAIGHHRISGDEASVKKLLQDIEGRFVGAPQRNEFLATEEIARGNMKAAAAYYRENIVQIPRYWASYESLGKMLFESGEIREAASLFSSYPGFKKGSDENRVGISNNAFEVGSYFYWSGHFDLAQPLYQIAASLGTGSGGEMTSALRLKLLAGDIHGALIGSYERARRYNDSYAYRDYLGMLHAMGQSKDAWAGFGALIRELPKPHLWETALVGHHIAGASEAELAEWVKQDSMNKTAEQTNTGARYLVRFATTDRTPSAELAALIDGVDRPIWQMEGANKAVVRPSDDGNLNFVLGPGVTGGNSVLPLGMLAGAKKHRVKSNLAYFADAYRAIKLGDFPAAKKSFDEAATLYDLTGESVFMLPYYALAAAKTGDAAAFELILQRFPISKQRFDYHLAKAVLAGVAANTEDTIKALSLARYRRPYTEKRPLLTQYTYGDVCELLAKATGNAKIRDAAIEWARQSQRSEPWQSWSYAIEAALTANPADRKRAIAMTHYLDPKSERLSAFKTPEIDEAVKIYGKSNPFLKKPGEPVRGSAT